MIFAAQSTTDTSYYFNRYIFQNISMRRTINLKKGLNLSLAGGLSSTEVKTDIYPSRIAVIPDDFPGFTPKLDVAEGETVGIGQPIMHDKTDTDITIVSPVEGTVESIVRGARRKIERVVIKTGSSDVLPIAYPTPTTPAETRHILKRAGLWAMLRQRPYDIVPTGDSVPRDIFVTAMDTAPLALDMEKSSIINVENLKAGVKTLSRLTDGHIYIGVKKGSSLPDIDGAEMVEFNQLHPAGNAGVQAANIAPVSKGETIWTLDAITLAKIGSLMTNGTISPKVTVALTGSELVETKVVETVPGADLADLVKSDISNSGHPVRVISGNVLTGSHEGIDGFLRYPYRQVTVIPEGSDADEFMGWASVSPRKMSVSPSFIGRFFGKNFTPDARLQGGRRAMIMSEIYDRYFPMDILPEYLIKAVIAKDIDQMEALGIYEVAPEDFALAEYADPSKIELQRIVRQGLDYLRSEV